jgi:TetR/AcrR family transcriptional regulator, regulator of autoinduction and epiphytic fitness
MRGKRAGQESRGVSGGRRGERPSPAGSAPDRRRLRGNRTRTALLDAAIGLAVDREATITAQRIADRAGVARRTLYHHFVDLDVLLLEAARLQALRHRAQLAPLPPIGSVDDRIRATCHQRRELFESVAPVYRAAVARTHGHPGFDEFLAELRTQLRRQLVSTLYPELEALGRRAPVALDALEVATGWSTWHTLRIDTNRSPEAAERITVFAATRILH